MHQCIQYCEVDTGYEFAAEINERCGIDYKTLVDVFCYNRILLGKNVPVMKPEPEKIPPRPLVQHHRVKRNRKPK